MYLNLKKEELASLIFFFLSPEDISSSSCLFFATFVYVDNDSTNFSTTDNLLELINNLLNLTRESSSIFI